MPRLPLCARVPLSTLTSVGSALRRMSQRIRCGAARRRHSHADQPAYRRDRAHRCRWSRSREARRRQPLHRHRRRAGARHPPVRAPSMGHACGRTASRASRKLRRATAQPRRVKVRRRTTGGRTATKLAAAFGVTEEVLSARAPDAAPVIGSFLDALAQRPRLWLHADLCRRPCGRDAPGHSAATRYWRRGCRLCVAVAALRLQIGVTDRALPSDEMLRVLLAQHPTHAEALGAKLGAAARGRRSSFRPSLQRPMRRRCGVGRWHGRVACDRCDAAATNRRALPRSGAFPRGARTGCLCSARRRPHVAMSDSRTCDTALQRVMRAAGAARDPTVRTRGGVRRRSGAAQRGGGAAARREGQAAACGGRGGLRRAAAAGSWCSYTRAHAQRACARVHARAQAV